MLRIIIERHECDCNMGINSKDYLTMDIESDELEKQLRAGGSGPNGFEVYRVQGVEVLDAND